MAWKVPFLDLRVVEESAREELIAAVDAVLRHGRLVMGPEVEELELAVAARCGRTHAVGVGSGTDALFLGLKSLGIGPGDEVITTSLSWIATANAIRLTGATPVFADVQEDLNIDPSSVEKLIGPHTRAIVPVHYTGKVCQMSALMELAEQHGLLVVEDASQAFDARYRGRKAGSFGAVGCFSMNPMKVFGACGEAGMVLTDRDDVYDRLVALRYNGTVNREECIEASLNGRLDTLQAAILLKRLKDVDRFVGRRREIASRYNAAFAGVVATPQEGDGEWDVYYTYTIRAPERDELKRFLEAKGVETKIQHPYLMPQQPAYRDGAKGEFPRARRLVREILSIPANEKLTPTDVDYVAACVREFYKVDG
jgi:dTDP-4-amino-4,6-dideoxygalactose transaminase